MSKERYAEPSPAWESLDGYSVTKGNYNLADIERKYIPIQTEIISDNKDKTIAELQQRIAELEAKLAEKEKEIERLKVYDEYRFELPYPKVKILGKTFEDIQELLDKWVEQGSKNKISLAVEQLEKVKKLAEKEIKECNKLLQDEFEDDYYIQSVNARQSMCYEFRREIDSQIQQLKEKNDA